MSSIERRDPQAELERALRANVTRILWLNAAWMFLVVMPVMVPFYRHHGLSMQEVYLLQSIFAVATLALELPTGYLADLLGRKRALVAAGLFGGLGFTTLAHVESFGGFVVFECLMAVGVAFFSGSDVALLYQSLERLPYPPEAATRAMGRKLFHSQLGETLASILGGALAVVSLELPAQVNAVTGWVPLFVALGLHEPPGPRLASGQHLENLARVARTLFAERLTRHVVATLVVSSATTLVAVWSFQASWRETGIPLAAFGWLWAGYNLTVALTGRFAHRLEESLGFGGVVALVGVLPVVGFLGMGCSAGALGAAFGLAFQVCRGLDAVCLRDALNVRVPEELRATANSVASLGMRLAFALAGPLVGRSMDEFGVGATLRGLGAASALAALAVCAPLWLAWRAEARRPPPA